MNATLDLKPAALKRPMDPAAMGNDIAALRQICGMLNDPNITGASVPEEEKAANQKLFAGAAAAIPAGQPMLPPPAKSPAKSPAQLKPKSGAIFENKTLVSGVPTIFFTGHAKVGKSFLAAQVGALVLEFDDPIYAMAANAFGQVQEAQALRHFVMEVRAWGEGTVTPSAPLNSIRALFIIQVRATGKDGLQLFGVDPREFGTPGFWTRSLLARVQRHAAKGKPIAVTDVVNAEQYQGLRQAGFAPYHVMCNNVTRSSRGGNAITNGLADGIERDLTLQISQAPTGSKFWAVWSDEKYPAPTPRLLTVAEFLGRINK